MLNQKQQEVVDHIDGPLMVLAGAGSGKTKALTHRIEKIICSGVNSHQILAITFTNKAAKEMKERVDNLISNQSFIATFHRFCLFILRKEYESVRLKKNFTIYDDSESKAIVKALLNRYIDVMPFIKEDPNYSINNIRNFISEVQHKGILSDEELTFYSASEFYHFYLDYESELLRSNAVDFNNIINKVLLLFQNSSLRQTYTNQYKYLLVDEYQDTNKAQFQLINFFAKDHSNICVIGDEDQSIYSFRGADINNILDFENVFKDVKVIKLEQNYRSSSNILNCANHVVQNNQYRKGKYLFTENEDGDLVGLYSFFSDYEEAEHVISDVYNRIRNGENPNEMTIMFRNNAHSRQFEEKLRELNVPYNFSGGVKFFDRKEIKDSLAYLRVVSNPIDNYSLMRILNTPTRGIGKKAQKDLLDYAYKNNISLWEALPIVTLPKKTRVNINNFIDMIKRCISLDSVSNISKIFNFIMDETLYSQILEKSSDYVDQARYENIEEFKTLLREQDSDMLSLSDFLENITIDQATEDEADRINLMTIHASKGLEFDTVYVIGLEEGIFPSRSALKQEDKIGIEEERRLFYVALTRARKNLSLSYVTSRFIYGRKERMIPSRFIDEIPEEYLDLF